MKNTINQVTADEMNQRKLEYSNLEFFRTNLNLTNAEFVESIGISISHYYNLRDCKTPVEPDKFKKLPDIAYLLTQLIKKDDGLSKRFPNPIIPTDLLHTDFSQIPYQEVTSSQFYSFKFAGNYIAYYTSTNTSGEKQPQYGVMSIKGTDSPNDFIAEGLFSIKTYEDALKIFKLVNEPDFTDFQKLNTNKYPHYSGEAHLTLTMLWLNMGNDSKSEYVSMSYDLTPKILTKNPKKNFFGALGIGLSQSSGQGNQTVTFPIVITKKEILCSENELAHYLHFNHTNIDKESINGIANRITKLIESFKGDSELSDLLDDALKRLLSKSISSYLSNNAYNSYYFSQSYLDDFYQNIILPIRKKYEPTV